MAPDPHSDTLVFRAYRVPALCWRCWKWFGFFTPNEFEDVLLFHCDQCGAVRAMNTYGEGNYTGVESKYIDFHYPDLPRSEDKKHAKEFLDVFENSWAEHCHCGGHFRLRAPIRCPRCHARGIQFLVERHMRLMDSPPIPVLKFAIPTEYVNASSRPPRYPEPEIIFVPGPPPTPGSQNQYGEAAETATARQAFEEQIAELVHQRLESMTTQLSQTGLTVGLGPIEREETQHIRYSSEYALVVRRAQQVVETIRFYVYNGGHRVTDESHFTTWLDRVLRLLCEGKSVTQTCSS